MGLWLAEGRELIGQHQDPHRNQDNDPRIGILKHETCHPIVLQVVENIEEVTC